MYEFTLGFHVAPGCPLLTLQLGAEFTSATVVRTVNDSRCEGNNVRKAILRSEKMPDMAHWASLMIGATRLGEIKTIA